MLGSFIEDPALRSTANYLFSLCRISAINTIDVQCSLFIPFSLRSPEMANCYFFQNASSFFNLSCQLLLFQTMLGNIQVESKDKVCCKRRTYGLIINLYQTYVLNPLTLPVAN